MKKKCSKRWGEYDGMKNTGKQGKADKELKRSDRTRSDRTRHPPQKLHESYSNSTALSKTNRTSSL